MEKWTSPLLEKMVATTNQMNLDYKIMLHEKYNSPQNAIVGKVSATWGDMPAVQVREYIQKGYAFKYWGLRAEIDAAGKSAKEMYDEMQEAGRKSITTSNDCERVLKLIRFGIVRGREEIFQQLENTGSSDLGSLKAEQCPGAHDCMPAGRRSRMEWCNCGKIIE